MRMGEAERLQNADILGRQYMFDAQELNEIRRKTANKYGAKGKEYIAALGRGSYPDNLVASLFNQHQRAIDRGQRNLVGQSFLKMIDNTEVITNKRTVVRQGEVVELERSREEIIQEIQDSDRITEAQKEELISRIDAGDSSVSVERVDEYRDIVQGVGLSGKEPSPSKLWTRTALLNQ